MLAAKHGHTEIVNTLLHLTKDLSSVDELGWSALCQAVYYRHTDIVRILLEHGFSANHLDKLERSPLMLAAEKQCVDIIKLLLDWGSQVNYKDSRNVSPIHIATTYCIQDKEENQLTILKLFLLHGVDVRLKDHKKLSALDWHLLGTIMNPQVQPLLYASGCQISKNLLKNSEKYKFHIAQFIREDQEVLLPLRGLCRRGIRTHLLSPVGGNHGNLITAVPWLPLPKQMKDLLLFNVSIERKSN